MDLIIVTAHCTCCPVQWWNGQPIVHMSGSMVGWWLTRCLDNCHSINDKSPSLVAMEYHHWWHLASVQIIIHPYHSLLLLLFSSPFNPPHIPVYSLLPFLSFTDPFPLPFCPPLPFLSPPDPYLILCPFPCPSPIPPFLPIHSFPTLSFLPCPLPPPCLLPSSVTFSIPLTLPEFTPNLHIYAYYAISLIILAMA